MAIRTIDTYNIGLDIEQSDKTKKNLADLQSAFNDETKSLEDIQELYNNIAKEQKEHNAEAKEYNKLLRQRMTDLEAENQKLINSSTEEGKKARNRLRELKVIEAQGKLDKAQKKELEKLEKSYVALTDEEIKQAKEKNTESRKALAAVIAQRRKELVAQKSLKELVKEDLKLAKERLKTQLKFISSLKTTEGRYKAIKKAMGATAKGVGKAAAVGGGLVSGLVGGAVASAEAQVETEKQARRLKVGIPDEEKLNLINNLKIATGKDSASIVEAINRVSSVVKTSKPAELMQMARAELEFPGAATLFQSQTGQTQASDFTVFQNRLRKIQSVTGSSIDDLDSIMKTVSNFKDSAFKAGISQQDLLSLYSALQGSNAYDSSEDIEKAMRAFLSQSNLTKDNFYSMMGSYDWSKHVRGSQNKNQATRFSQTFDFKALEGAANSKESTSISLSPAEKAAESARRIAVKKDELVARILTKVAPLLEDGTLDKIIDSAFEILKVIEPLIKPVMEGLKKLLDVINPIMAMIAKIIKRIDYAISNSDGIKDFFEKLASGGEMAQGGIAISPTIVGERGAEAIIPLGYARQGRATNIIQNINQNFSMIGNQTTALSLSSAIKQRSFTDTFLSDRLYGG